MSGFFVLVFIIIVHSIVPPVFAQTNSNAATLTLTISSTTLPSDVPGPIDPSFAGFGIEPSNLFSFMGQEAPNELTLTLLNNLVGYTGQPPHIRLGGNTEDYMVYRDTQDQWAWIDNPDPQGTGAIKSDSMLIGPRFFEVANRLPKGTPVTWGLNLGYEQPGYMSEIVTMATQVITKCTNIKLVSFEIGNEPDLYLQNGLRTGQWDGDTYTQHWLERAAAVYEQVLAPNGIQGDFFEAASTASTIGTTFQISDLVTFSMGDSGPAQTSSDTNTSATSYLRSWNQHDYYYYIGVSSYALTLERLMQLETTETQFAAWEQQVQQSLATPYPYALREMGVVGPIGQAGVTDVFGAALWTLNFLLYTASLGVSSVQLHMTDNSAASAWQPIEMDGCQPFVRPLYYGIAAFDQVIGRSCEARVEKTQIQQYPGDYNGFVKAYQVYQGDQLASVVVVNGKMVNTTVSNKTSLTVQVQLPASMAGQIFHLSYLTGPGADATLGTTWNGISYEASGDGTPTQASNSDETVTIGGDGVVSVSVRDSEAVVANLGQKVGTNYGVNETACSAAAQRSPGVGTTTVPSSPTSVGNMDDKKSDAVPATQAPSPTPTQSAAAALLTVSFALVLGVLML